MLSLSSLLLAVASSVVAMSGVGEGIRSIGGEGLTSKLRLLRRSSSNNGVVVVELSFIAGSLIRCE